MIRCSSRASRSGTVTPSSLSEPWRLLFGASSTFGLDRTLNAVLGRGRSSRSRCPLGTTQEQPGDRSPVGQMTSRFGRTTSTANPGMPPNGVGSAITGGANSLNVEPMPKQLMAYPTEVVRCYRHLFQVDDVPKGASPAPRTSCPASSCAGRSGAKRNPMPTADRSPIGHALESSHRGCEANSRALTRPVATPALGSGHERRRPRIAPPG